MNSNSIYSETDFEKKIKRIQYSAQKNRIAVLDVLHQIGTGHWGGSASSAELLATLYNHILNVNPEKPDWVDRDRLVLAKGHAAPMLYTVLAGRGYFPFEELQTLRQLHSRLQGHPCMLKTPGVDMSTGALGHGISVGLGMALAAKLSGKKYWTFVLVGEGCLNEGESWEGMLSVAKFKPGRLVIMVDNNKVQLDGFSDDVMPLDSLIDKFKAFNLNVSDTIYDGHDVAEILKSWDWMQENQEKPVVVIYKTHKGKGVSFMEDNYLWHGGQVDDESYKKGRVELEKALNELKKIL